MRLRRVCWRDLKHAASGIAQGYDIAAKMPMPPRQETDLMDRRWAVNVVLVPAAVISGWLRRTAMRERVDAIFHVLRTGHASPRLASRSPPPSSHAIASHDSARTSRTPSRVSRSWMRFARQNRQLFNIRTKLGGEAERIFRPPFSYTGRRKHCFDTILFGRYNASVTSTQACLRIHGFADM